MFNFILLIATISLFIVSLGLIIIDLVSKKRHQNKSYEVNFPKLSRNSVIMALIALILLVLLSLSVP